MKELIGAPSEEMQKLLLKNIRYVIRKCTYILLVDDHDEASMYHEQTN